MENKPAPRDAVIALLKTDRPAALEVALQNERENPNSRYARELHAYALASLFEFEKAVEQYRRAADLGTTSHIEASLGRALRMLGRYQESAQHYVRAMTLSDATIGTRAIAANAVQLAGDRAFARQLAFPGANAPQHSGLDFARWMIDFDRRDLRRQWRDRLLESTAAGDNAIYFWSSLDSHAMVTIDHKNLLARMLESAPGGPPRWWPTTFRLPEQEQAARLALAADPDAIWIAKPPRLVAAQHVFILTGSTLERWPEGEAVLQRFVDPPFLYEGRKVNIRVHVSLLAPFTEAASLWHDGLVFISTDDYVCGSRGAMFVNPLSANKAALSQPVGTFAAAGVSLNEFMAAALDEAGARRVRDGIVEIASELVGRMEESGVLEAMRQIPGWRGLPPTFFGLDIGLDADLKPWLFEAERNPGHGLGSPATAEVWRRFRRDWLPFALAAPDAARSSFIRL